ncbi:hypothetical protein ABBQ32_010553 [Trebouxia sp. C0010 RCD-2024]
MSLVEPPAVGAQDHGTAGVLPAEVAPKVPPLQLPHTGVTWSEQLDKAGSLVPQASSAKRAQYKGRESVSMYLEDAAKTMQVVTALRDRQVFTAAQSA